MMLLQGEKKLPERNSYVSGMRDDGSKKSEQKIKHNRKNPMTGSYNTHTHMRAHTHRHILPPSLSLSLSVNGDIK